MRIGTCSRCHTENIQLTRDHIIPAILGRICDEYGVPFKWNAKKNIDKNVCLKCNKEKGSKIITTQGFAIWNKLVIKHNQGEITLSPRDLKKVMRMMSVRSPILSFEERTQIIGRMHKNAKFKAERKKKKKKYLGKVPDKVNRKKGTKLYIEYFEKGYDEQF